MPNVRDVLLSADYVVRHRCFHFVGVTRDFHTKYLKVYPHYMDAVYVRYSEKKLEDGSISKTIVSLSGGADLPEITPEMLESGVIPGVRLIEEKEAGIDTLEFLNLKGE